ncbi:hypothetical protein AALM99_06865 [Lactococcus muris]|uniref:Uncharacterized protein n=1 Tax=Lactococcus muris TaxID=2941330 RepID=A0ABV4D8T3_9LACT
MKNKTKKLIAQSSFSLATLVGVLGFERIGFAAVTVQQTVAMMQNNVKWGFGTAGVIVALLGLGWLFLNWDDGPAARRSPIFTLVGGIILVGLGFAIAGAISAPPGA